MKTVVFVLLPIVSILTRQSGVSGLKCYSCEGGVRTNCAKVGTIGDDEDCEGRNAQCYEALIAYQNGALTLVQRRCWQTPEGSSATDFCKSFNNPAGKIIKCITCKTNLCNTHRKFWL